MTSIIKLDEKYVKGLTELGVSFEDISGDYIVRLTSPKLNLKPSLKTLVNVKLGEELTELMRVYECGGWKKSDGTFPTNALQTYSGDIDVDVKNGFHFWNRDDVRDFYNSHKIISLEKFYQNQKITLKTIAEINNHFKTRMAVQSVIEALAGR